MELYAAGFNAWNQLDFCNDGADAGIRPEPRDVTPFTRILSAETIERPISHLSATLVKAGDKILVAGFLDASDAGNLARLYHSVSTATGKTLGTRRRATLSELTDDDHDDARARVPSAPVKQLAAYDTGFAALLEDASVWVNGDERFPNCLGGSSDPDEDQRAGSWSRVHWLDDLPTGPVVKIAAGGYTLAALTEGGDLYCWGGRPGQAPLFEDLSNVPVPVDVGVDADVRDMALGDHHIIVLTTDGKVLVRGCNKNGQLGLEDGASGADWVEDWTRVQGIPNDGSGGFVGVEAGPKASFILYNNPEQADHRNSS